MTPQPGSAPLTRLRSREYVNTVRALVPGYEPTFSPSPDAAAPAEPATAQWVSELHRVAHEAARDVSADPLRLRSLTECDPERNAEDCREQFIERFGSRAFRHPLTADERMELASVFATGQRLGSDFAHGVRAVLEVVLQSPELVYLPELGDGQEQNGSVSLTPHEVATRLAYFVTGAPPDDELSGAAERDELDADGIAREARRLLGSPASRAEVAAFYRERYELRPRLDGESSELAALALQETNRFVADVTFDGAGTFRALLTEPTTWVNEPLARHYGYSGVTGDAFRKLTLDPEQRGGLFTQASFLASGAEGFVRPMHRAVRALRGLLCVPVPPPPPEVEFPVTQPTPGATTREMLSEMTAAEICQSCHMLLNPVGFAFEHYDDLGKFRDTEGDRPIDASGELPAPHPQGAFPDASELLRRIAESEDGKACFVRHWQELANRRPAEPADHCSEASLREGFAATDGNVAELIVALAQSDNFRFRQKSELPGRD